MKSIPYIIGELIALILCWIVAVAILGSIPWVGPVVYWGGMFWIGYWLFFTDHDKKG